MRKFAAAFGFFFACLHAFCQTSSVKGTVTDTAEKKNLAHAVVSLLKRSDSTLVQFTRTDSHGAFRLSGVTADTFVMLITYPKYADFMDQVVIVAGTTTDLGVVALTERSVLLKEVIVHSTGAIRIKGDTTEFVADSFKLKEGATVEDLLKRLPGLSVNSKGEITAQGKQVDKVLVDGEEFFGNDPTIATQNIAAKQVDKIQVYDTKTEQDQLKGIGGGNDSKTINIKLKDNAKKGYFGRAEAGSDFNRLHNGKVLYNNFLGNRKLSVFGTKSNTSTGSLGWEERNKLGIENDFEYDEIGGFYMSFGSDDDFNDWGLQGLPNAYSAGGLFSNKWNNEKDKLNLSYTYNRLGTTNETSTLKETLLPDTIFYNNETSTTRGLKQQHVFAPRYEWKIDSLTTIKFTSVNTYKTTQTSGTTHSEALDENHQFVNTESRSNSQDVTHQQSDNQLTYTQHFKKKGRAVIATLRYSNIHDDLSGSLNSIDEFYRGGSPDSTAVTDQLKKGSGLSQTYGAKLTYNEPLNKDWNLVTEYSYNHNNSTSRRNTFEKDLDGKYTILNPVYSNNFDLNAYANTGTLTLRYIGKKIKSTLGGGISAVQLGVNDLDHSNKHVYNFTNFSPQAQVNYSPKPQTSIGFRYTGSTVQPRIDQLQPVRNNNDPLNVFIGNPNLRVGFRHDMQLWFNRFQILRGRYMYFQVNYTLQDNAVANYSTVDSFGKTTSTPVNVQGVNNYNFFGWWTSGDGDKKLIHEFGPSVQGGRNITFINGQQSINTYANLELEYGIRYSVQDKFNFNIRPKVGRNISTSSLRKDVNNDYWTYGGEVEGYIALPWKLEVSSNINFDLRQRIPAFSGSTNTNLIVWNADLSKKIFKDKSGKIIFMANDILDQNKGFNRVINSNFITDQRYQRVGQYFMLTLQWTFTKMPGVNK